MTSTPVPLAEQPTADAATQWLRIYVNDDGQWPERDHPRRAMLRVILGTLQQHERLQADLAATTEAFKRVVAEKDRDLAGVCELHAKALRERDEALQQHERAMAVVDAARKAVRQIRVHGETCHELTDALAALDGAANTEGDAG